MIAINVDGIKNSVDKHVINKILKKLI